MPTVCAARWYQRAAVVMGVILSTASAGRWSMRAALVVAATKAVSIRLLGSAQ